MEILAVTSRSAGLSDFLNALQVESGMGVVVATSGAAAMERIKTDLPPFVVLDKALPDFKPLKLAMEILTVNAMTNMAAITDLSDEDYHEESEGLGILCAIAPEPSMADAQKVAEMFKRFA